MKRIYMLCLLLCISSCSSSFVTGIHLEDNIIEKFIEDKASKEHVKNVIGPAVINSDFTKNNLYYIEQVLLRKNFSKPRISKQIVYKLYFNDDNVIESFEKFVDSYNHIKIDKKSTKTNPFKLNGFQKFVRNFGRFN